MAQNSNRRLNGINPLSYIGTNPYTPPDFVDYPFAPGPTDSKNFSIGTFWLNTGANNPPLISDLYVLVDLDGGVATWLPFTSGSGTVITLTSNTGGPVDPDGAGNINVVGDGTTITGVGVPGTHTITLSAVGTGLIQSLTGNSGGAVFPTAGNTNIVGSGVVTVAGNPGTSTLTISISGGGFASSFPTDSGTATPVAGVLNIIAGVSTLNCGSSVEFTGSGNTVQLHVTDAHSTTAVGLNAGSATLTGSSNVLYGAGAGSLYTSTEDNNVIIGTQGGQVGERGIVRIGNLGVGGGTNNTTFVGTNCGNLTLTGTNNTGFGNAVLKVVSTGERNNAFGHLNLAACTTGSNNSAFGNGALASVITGNFNCAYGELAGSNYTTNESSNIIIGATVGGTVGESNVCRIGVSTGSGDGQLAKTFIAGIRGVTTGVNDAVAVLIDSAGQLGTVSSSIRYKENIESLEHESDDIYRLRPKSFTFKDRPCHIRSIGLIAEEVEEIIPSLVVYDKEGNPDSVKYHELPVLLLNELIKLRKRVEELEENLS